MKRNIKSVACTINLSQPKTCIRPLKFEKLMNSDEFKEISCKKKYLYDPPRPVSVKVCTRRVLEDNCSSKILDCPKSSEIPEKSNKLICGIKLLLKGSIVFGLIYWSTAEGLWSDSGQTENFYYRVMSTIAPSLPDISSIEQLPRLDKITYNIYDYYNRAVRGIVHILIAVPTIISKKLHKIVCGNNEEIDNDNNNE